MARIVGIDCSTSPDFVGLLVPVLMYATLRLLVRREEAHLEQVFGEEYRRYRSGTPAVFPVLWRWRG